MPQNPYDAPQAELRKTENLPARPIRAILVGLAIDFGGTFITGTVITFIFAVIATNQGASQAQLQKTLSTSATDPFSMLGACLTIGGLAMSYVAGYFCLRVSRSLTLRYPTLLATIVFVLGVATAWQSWDPILLVGLCALGFGVTMLGAVNALRAST